MRFILLRMTIAHALRHRLRTSLTSLSIVAGVATVVALHGASDSILRVATEAARTIAGRAQISVENGHVGIPEPLLERVRAVEGVIGAAPMIRATATAVRLDGEPLEILGIDLLDDHTIRTYDATGDEAEIEDPLELLVHPSSVVLTHTFARRKGLKLDDEIDLLTPAGVTSFRVAGFLEPSGPARAFGGNVALMDIFSAQEMFGTPGRFDRIDVVVAADRSVDTVRSDLQRRIGDQARVVSSERHESGVVSQIAAVSFVMRSASLIGLCLALFLVHNALSISVAQRRREFAIVRSVGVTAGELQRHVLLETVLFALPACLVGLPLGLMGARAATRAIAQTISDNIANIGYVDRPPESSILVLATLLGLSAALLGAMWSARSAARTSPLLALRRERENLDRAAGRGAPAVGILLLAAGAFVAVGRPGASAVPSLLVFPCLGLGAALCLSAFLRAVAPGAGRVLGRLAPVIGRVAADGVRTAPQRSAATVGAIMLAAAALVSLRIMLSNLLIAAQQWGDGFFPLDLMVTSGAPMYGARANLMPESLEKALRNTEGIRAVNVLRISEEVPTEAGDIRVVAQDFDLWRREGGYQPILQGDPRAAIDGLLAGGILVSDNLSRRTGRKVGDYLTFRTPGGSQRLLIEGVYAGGFLSHPNGAVEMDLGTFRRHWRDSRASNFNLFLDGTVPPRQVADTVRREHARPFSLFVIDRVEFLEIGFDRLNEAFRLTRALEVILVLLAAFSVVNTLVASVLDRVGEIAQLRAVGATTTQVSRIVLLEAALLGAIGLVWGLALGAFAAYSLVGSFEFFDWHLPFRVPIASLATGAVGLLGVVLLSGWYPARRAAALPVARSLKEWGV